MITRSKLGTWVWFMVLGIAIFTACNTITDNEMEDEEEESMSPAIDKDVDPSIVANLPLGSRSFDMGTAGFIPTHYPNPTELDWNDFFDFRASLYGGIYGVHISPFDETDDENIPAQARLAFEEVQKVEPYIAFAIDFEDGPFTEEKGEEFKKVAVATAEMYQPKYISLGVESNSFYLFQPDTYDLYVEYARDIYDDIKSVSPSTLVMNNFQLDRMKGQTDLTGESFDPHWRLIDRFTGKIDLVSFTVYPFLHYDMVEQIPKDYLSVIRQHTDLPVMITETGWPTENLISGVSGSDQAQSTYIQKIAYQSDELDVVALIWVFPHDAGFGIAGGIFDNLSLFTNDGSSKPGYEYWKAIYSLPKN